MALGLRHLWSFSGDDDRQDVNQSLIEPFVNYNLKNGWFLISDMIITPSWEASSGNDWTVPLGGGLGRVFKIGTQPINARLEGYYNVVQQMELLSGILHLPGNFYSQSDSIIQSV